MYYNPKETKGKWYFIYYIKNSPFGPAGGLFFLQVLVYPSRGLSRLFRIKWRIFIPKTELFSKNTPPEYQNLRMPDLPSKCVQGKCSSIEHCYWPKSQRNLIANSHC